MTLEAKVGGLSLWEGAVSQGYGKVLEAEKSPGNFRKEQTDQHLDFSP